MQLQNGQVNTFGVPFILLLTVSTDSCFVSSHFTAFIHRVYCWNQGCGVGVGGVACFQLESESGVGVGFLKLLESESGVGVVFLKLLESESGVGVGFSKLLESESGVGVGKFVAITDSNVY